MVELYHAARLLPWGLFGIMNGDFFRKWGNYVKDKVRAAADLLIGILLISSVIWGYHTDWSYAGEYCFLSGSAVGVLFLISFLSRAFLKKPLQDWLFFDGMIALLLILIATRGLGLAVEGAFIFIHLINPTIVFFYWAVFCDHRAIRKRVALPSAVVFPLFYILLSAILLRVNGACAFPANLILVGNSLPVILLIVAGLSLGIILIGFLLHSANRAVRKRIGKRE
jgi:hypothetical protein